MFLQAAKKTANFKITGRKKLYFRPLIEERVFMKYAIVDLETTGGSYAADKITEIALYVYDGQTIIRELCTLINPECNIPYQITKLTGITNEMVLLAPKFYEIAKELVQITEDCTIVAHNVNFDYNFIRNEFKQLGYNYNRPHICTVKLSRKLLSGYPSYSLGKLCQSLNFQLINRHRATGDARATLELFKLLLTKEKEPEQIQLNGTHPSLRSNDIAILPESTGVYYMHNFSDDIIYIGKSKNINQRIQAHLNNVSTKKSLQLKENITKITYHETGSELIALLMECHEIKRYNPLYNRALKKQKLNIGLFWDYNREGYITFHLQKYDDSLIPLTSYSSDKQAKNHLIKLMNNNDLCEKFCGLWKGSGACFHFSIKKCHGACIGKETVKKYNLRAKNVIQQLSFKDTSFAIIDKGRYSQERSLVLVKNGKYLGFGYINPSMITDDFEQLEQYITRQDHHRDIQQIIKGYLKKHKVEKYIVFHKNTVKSRQK